MNWLQTLQACKQVATAVAANVCSVSRNLQLVGLTQPAKELHDAATRLDEVIKAIDAATRDKVTEARESESMLDACLAATMPGRKTLGKG